MPKPSHWDLSLTLLANVRGIISWTMLRANAVLQVGGRDADVESDEAWAQAFMESALSGDRLIAPFADNSAEQGRGPPSIKCVKYEQRRGASV